MTDDTHLDRLLAELGDRAQAELEQVRRDADAQAQAMSHAAEARAQIRTATALAECEAETMRRQANAIADARRAARGALLQAQHALVDRVCARARRRLAPRFADAANGDTMHRRLAELVTFAATTDVEARVPSGTAIDSTPQWRKTESPNAPPGFTLIGDGGHVIIEDTVDAWLNANRPQIAIDVCRAVEAG